VTTTLEPATDAHPPAPRAVRATRRDHIALGVLLVATAVLYLWNITINGMGNQFYAGAVWAGSKNWEALLFGSLDPHNFITVDKPPMAQWVMGLSGQIFGFSSASMLIPDALIGVLSVWLLYAAVKRICGPAVGLLAGAILALMPVAVLMFRYNNPDAAMVLMMTAAAYCTVRALWASDATGKTHGASDATGKTPGASDASEVTGKIWQSASIKWVAWGGVALGFAFLAKMLEGLMVMPALGAAYLFAAPVSLRRRLEGLLAALGAFLVSSGWYVVLTMLWPASTRPYMAGSSNNSFMDLVLGYNGVSRVLGHNHFGGQSTGVIGQAAGFSVNRKGGFGMGDQAQGLPRLFSGEFAVEIGWLVPAALIAVIFVLVSRGRLPRTDLIRASAILFGGWLIVDGLVLSFMNTNIHPYYCLSIAPAVAAMIAIGGHEAWRLRATRLARITVAAVIIGTGIWSWWILGWNSGWMPALRWVILAISGFAAAGLLATLIKTIPPRVVAASVGIGLLSILAGPTAYSLATIGQPQIGGSPLVGPAHPKRPNWFQLEDNPALTAMLRDTHTQWSAAVLRSSNAANLELDSDTAVMAIGGFGGTDPAPSLSDFIGDVHQGKVTYYLILKNRGWGPGRADVHSDITTWVKQHFPAVTVGSATVYNLTVPVAIDH
jgi:4-amino-4-deoxy-L-arabinose transferase-like glycosyltransferase